MMINATKEFEEFVNELKKVGINVATENLDDATKQVIGSTYEKVLNFLNTHNLIPADKYEQAKRFDTVLPSLNSNVRLSEIGPEAIYDLCMSCGVPQDKLYEAARAVAACIEKYNTGNAVTEHFASVSNESLDSSVEKRSVDLLYSPSAVSSYFVSPEKALSIAAEAFGVNIDNTIVDAKIAITLTILKFHRSVINRMLPTQAVNSNLIIFKAPRLEIYDLTKSMADTAAERYSGSHRIPFIDLYRDPSPANTGTKPIIPLSANDKAGKYLIQDGILKVGVTANLFDLAKVPGVFGYSHVDYTDLVSEGARIKTIVVKVKNTETGDEELFGINVSFKQGARYVPSVNSSDSGDRIANLDEYAVLSKDSPKLDGTTSSVLSFLDDNHYIRLNIKFMSKLNLKTSYVDGNGNVVPKLKTKDGTDPVTSIETTYEKLTFTIIGYEVDAYYNEENLRKTTSALRLQTKTFAYEIPGSKNVVVDYSLIQEEPDEVINALNKYLSIGYDDRAIKIMLDNLEYVYAWYQQETEFNFVDNYEKSILNEFVAGHIVKPVVLKFTMKLLPNINNMRSSDLWGDIRALAEKQIMDLITDVFNKSYYDKQLDPGEAPTFSVLTSGYILDALLSVPHIHNHLEQGTQKEPDDVVEFRRVLPNGTVLNVYTTTFDYITNKMIIVPVRPKNPESILNYATNADRGTFVVQITPYNEGAGWRRVVANQRAFPIVTCPVGIIIEVENLSRAFQGSLGYGG